MILLDTNIVVALLNEQALALGELGESFARGEIVGISAIVVFELHYGAAKSARRSHNESRFAALLDSPIIVVPFDQEAAREAGLVRADLERKGVPIGPFDVLIAGHALSSGAVLVTNNTREFSRVQGLQVRDWLSPPN